MTQGSRAGHGKGAPDGLSAESIWESLIADTGAAVYVLSSDGEIEFLNAEAARCLGVDASKAVGRLYTELVPGAVGEERVGYVRRVSSSGEGMVFEQVCRGRRRRATLRVIPRPERGSPWVMMVCRAVSGPAEPGVQHAKHNDHGALESLTPREVEILRMIGEGLSTTQIATELQRSEKTVEWHRVALGTKLGAGNRVELARIAIHAGLVSVDHLPGASDGQALPPGA